MNEKLFLFNLDSEAEQFVKKIAGQMNIPVKIVPDNVWDSTVQEIVDGKERKTEAPPKIIGSLLLFHYISQKHFDRLLLELRKKDVKIDLKAIYTKTNSKWTIKHLYMELMREKIAYSKR